MMGKVEYIRQLEKENAKLNNMVQDLLSENVNLKCEFEKASNDFDEMMETIHKDANEEVGSVILSNHTCYQDFAGILINNGYGVMVEPINSGTKLRITIISGENHEEKRSN